MSTTDKILDCIDVGLQTPMPDPTFGEVSPPIGDGCVRCAMPGQGDTCEACRAYLLGDSEVDPAAAADAAVRAMVARIFTAAVAATGSVYVVPHAPVEWRSTNPEEAWAPAFRIIDTSQRRFTSITDC